MPPQMGPPGMGGPMPPQDAGGGMPGFGGPPPWMQGGGPPGMGGPMPPQNPFIGAQMGPPMGGPPPMGMPPQMGGPPGMGGPMPPQQGGGGQLFGGQGLNGRPPWMA